MSTATVSIRDLRTNFRLVKRKVEEHGQVIITDNGVPSYELKAMVRPRKPKQAPMPDYYTRVIRRQPKAMSVEEARRFHEENRGEC